MSQKKVIVLGGGLVGGPLAGDLAEDQRFMVTVADANAGRLAELKSKYAAINILQQDLSKPSQVQRIVSNYDLVVNAVPGFMGFATARAIIEAGRDSVCIAFYEEDPFLLDEIAKKNKVTMVMDCGVYPGMGSALIMHCARQMDEVESVLTFVGGLPVVRQWPSEYKAVFSPVDVIEEYIRPARYVENGHEVVKPALSDAEYLDFPGIGTLEAFNTDGLRTLARSLNAPNMKEKTLRYPGHIEKMKILRELGFFSKEKSLQIAGIKISPLQVTSQILFPDWQLRPGEEDITIFQSKITGVKTGRPVRYIIDLYDRFDKQKQVTSMARTTGYTAAMALRMISDGLYDHKGISPPEYMGREQKHVDYLMRGLQDRNVRWQIRQEPVTG